MTDALKKAFISYSWDSPEHKQWVGKFATALRAKGVEVILDQWDTDYGDDLAVFMERGVRNSDRVLIVCTEEYVRKADAGKGGVGYEKMIVTAELVQDIGTKKFIPIIRQEQGKDVRPVFLATRKYADFRTEATFDQELEALATSIISGAAVSKPPLGAAADASTPIAPITLPNATDDPAQAYNTALALVRSDDILGWRKFAQKLKRSFKPALFTWRSKYEPKPPENLEALHSAVDEAITYIAPPIAMALAGIESGKEKFSDQRALFDEFYHITEWSRNGRVILTELPTALGYVYQGLHGAICMHTDQYELALKFATMNIGFGNGKKTPLWRHHGVMGWPESLGRKCTESWKYLSDAFDRWHWLQEIFGTAEEYKISLISYYILLNFYEFAQTAHGLDAEVFEKEDLYLDIPLSFAMEDRYLCEKALSRISASPKVFESILKEWGVDKAKAISMWPKWLKACSSWLGNVFRWSPAIPHTDLLEYLGWQSKKSAA